MLNFDDLQARKDLLVDRKNQLMKRKWRIEDDLDNLKDTKTSYHRKGDFQSVSNINLTEKRLNNDLYVLKKQISEVNEELDALNIQMKDKEYEKLNEDYISRENLSRKDIERKITKSKNISERFHSLIKEYNSFLETIESYSEKIAKNEVMLDDLNQLKVEVETKIPDLKEYQKQSKDFNQSNELIEIIKENKNHLDDVESSFNDSADLSSRFESAIKNNQEFLDSIVDVLDEIHERYCDDDFDLMKAKVRYNILFLMKNHKHCFKFENFDELNDVLENNRSDLKNMKSMFNEAKRVLIKFESTVKMNINFLAKIDSTIAEIKEDYCYDDLRQMWTQIEAENRGLLNHFKKNFDFNILGELYEDLRSRHNSLNDNAIKLHNHQSLSNDFDLTLRKYSNLLMQISSYFADIDNVRFSQNLNLLNREITAKRENLSIYQKKCFEFNSFNELNRLLDNSNKDFEKLQDKFNQIKLELYDELLFNVTSSIQYKSDVCSELDSKASYLIDDAKGFHNLMGKKELLDNLNKIQLDLAKESENLRKIKSNFDNRIIENTTQVRQLSRKEILHLNNLMVMLNQVSVEDFEDMLSEQEEAYEQLSIQNENMSDDDVERLLNDFEDCFNKPMFKHQLKKYNLSDDELDLVKNDIINDIVNHEISDVKVNFKTIIKARCSEFRKSHVEFEEKELDEMIGIDSFTDVDDETLLECRNLVKEDLIRGNVTANNVRLKFKRHVNKKVKERNQLMELDKINADPNVPDIKIHLSQEENDEIYEIVQTEIYSEYGIPGNVEGRVYYWTNQKIRDNQSQARGRLNAVKRNFLTLTALDSRQQNEFIARIEFLISENRIKPYQISDDNIVKLSEDFMNDKL